ncbi:tetratricopeptide repeat protein [Roseibium denhamense]|uniref:Tetratricopeptide repeat protein n=1 Tax=Roseibium denhamense TaxID=76305 RepID=A0ABY1NKF3_9HYPH|nr:tetratricopeptide repeat protein [Roseibium denhamense]MTI06829.1 tetratricopeptide repeat protein [Roseibium denhamense]SMP11713.1 hypothetical protein SAMN06265374_1356 [Roseibium denhamense]
MRIFAFTTALLICSGFALAQPVPDLGPDVQPPSAEDFDALPDVPEDEGGQVVVEEDGGDEEKSRIDQLFADLAEADEPGTTQRAAREIQRAWMDSGSPTVNLLMARAGKAIQADDHALAMDLLDTIVILKPDYAEGWNRRATVHYMREDFGKSLVDIERVLALEPRHWGALSGLGIIQRRLGFEDDALKTFQRALAIHPGLENASEAVEDLQKGADGEPT